MKKLQILSILAFCMIAIISCGTSDKENNTYSENSSKFLKENFSDTSIVVKNKIPSNNDPLTLIGEITIPPCKSFDPKKVFSTDKDDNPIANFYHGSNFSNWFYDKALFVETQSSFKIKIYQTKRTVTDYEISNFTKEIPLSKQEMYQALAFLVSNQSNGEVGKMITSGHGNIFYVTLTDGAAVSVCARWGSVHGGWYLLAVDFDSWHEGYLVFSRGN